MGSEKISIGVALCVICGKGVPSHKAATHCKSPDRSWSLYMDEMRQIRSQLATTTEKNVDLKLQRDKLTLVCEEETGVIKTLTADLDTSEAACADLMTLNDKYKEALEFYADESLYFPRSIIRELKDTVRLAPIYSEFGETAIEALKATK